jgi:CheY-like chemotaxis protein
MRVLVCDDDRESAEPLAALLGLAAPEPLTVDVVYNGGHAVEKAREVHPEVVILDLEMPVLNGFHAAAEIRQSLSGAPPLLISVSGASSYVMAADAASAFDHVFRKPLDFPALLRLVFPD